MLIRQSVVKGKDVGGVRWISLKIKNIQRIWSGPWSRHRRGRCNKHKNGTMNAPGSFERLEFRGVVHIIILWTA